MAFAPVRWALRRSLDQVQHITPVPHGSATGLVAEVYAGLESEFGLLAPPVALHSPVPDLLGACWMLLRESLLADGRASRAAKEAVATGISEANACPYCVQVHSAALAGLGVTDAGEGPTAAWARGGGSAATASAFALPTDQLPELLGVSLAFHYLNRVVHVFLGDSPLPVTVPDRVAGVVQGAMGRMLRAPAVVPGRSLRLLPEAPLPADLAWAVDAPMLSDAIARACAAVEAAGARALSQPVQDVVAAELARWDGHVTAIGTDWMSAALSELPPADRGVGRYALLVAREPFRVDEEVVAAARPVVPDDAGLLAATSWVSLRAARRVVGAGRAIRGVA